MFSYNQSHKNSSALINKIQMRFTVIDWNTNISDYEFKTVVAIRVNEKDLSIMVVGQHGWLRVSKDEQIFMSKI